MTELLAGWVPAAARLGLVEGSDDSIINPRGQFPRRVIGALGLVITAMLQLLDCQARQTALKRTFRASGKSHPCLFVTERVGADPRLMHQ